jgi:HEAT repeat protein/ABC-type dipeptide/oligopeptide/nickel transport system ATPase subunit
MPTFSIEFVTDPGNTALDVFTNSNSTGSAAEKLERHWRQQNRVFTGGSRLGQAPFRSRQNGSRGLRFGAEYAGARRRVVNCNRLMTTFEQLKELNDADFHRLADAVLRRVDPRYRDLRPHGLNDAGQSIRGQPDSYVGNSADTCTIAFCYTTDRGDWWNKVVADIGEAAKISPFIEEIVAAIPRDADRDGPTKKGIDWLQKARNAAGRGKLTVYDGRRLSKYLDEDHQDLRWECLRIPFSRLSYEAMLASCHRASLDAVDDLKAKGRYNPDQYVVRESDGELRHIWRRAFTSVNGPSGKQPGRLIPLVSDSGFGKTSLLCSFAESAGTNLAVLLIEARDCKFDSEDALVRMVMQKLQGVLDPALRQKEEVAVSRELAKPRVLTVVLDGIDETRRASEVTSAIRYWLGSGIGAASVLIVSSRPDFWRRCSDSSWERWLPTSEGPCRDAASAAELAQSAERRCPEFAILQPFTTAELRAALARCGLDHNALDRLPREVQQELRHPFTFRAYVEVLKRKGTATLPRTRAEMMALWLEVRLEAESEPSLRVSQEIYWKALTDIAKSIQSAESSSIAVDALVSVPRFDAARPPGVVVERLIEANVLETLEGKNDTVRFVFDAVLEFFAAEADIEEIRKDRQSVVASLMKKSFSTTATRLNRIGARIGGTPAGDDFLKDLIQNDYARALWVLQACPENFSEEVRRLLFAEVRQNFFRARRPEMAFIIERLGYLESCPCGLHRMAAYSAIRLNLVPGAPLVAMFVTGGYPYYHSEVLSLLRGASAAFRVALAEHALTFLGTESDTPPHMRAVSTLGYLGDERLVEHLRERLTANGVLRGYENHALLALGSEGAAELYVESVRRTAAAIARGRHKDDEGSAAAILFLSISPRTADVCYLITPLFERHLLALISDPDNLVSRIAVDLALFSRKPALVRHVLLAGKHEAVMARTSELGDAISVSDWVCWWNEATSDGVRQSLLSISGRIPDVRIENAAIDSLRVPKLRGAGAAALARLGSIRCLPALRAALRDRVGDDAHDWWHRRAVAVALGELRGREAVGLLEDFVRGGDQCVQHAGLDSLARIGTSASEEALLRLSVGASVTTRFADDLARALIAHGSQRCVAKALGCSKQHPEGLRWLVKCMSHAFLSRGWTIGEYYTHVRDDELIQHVMSGESALKGADRRDLVGCVEQIDSENARRLLRQLASRAGTEQDTIVRADGQKLSSLAHEELMHRGDGFSIKYFVSRALERGSESYWFTFEEMRHFGSDAIVSEVKDRFAASPPKPEHVARLLSLLGSFGGPGDIGIVEPYLDCADDLVSNVAYETKIRLTDPLRLAVGWQEILIE